ncbi:MAG: hypothetical protein PHE21_02495 [Candidatus Dojkabacteria bacterium]|nr:hypothetical protein [Candidatus Dojkabacteria bacterium]
MDNKKEDLNEKKQFFIDNISKFCDKCGNPFSIEDVNIIQNTGVSSIIHFSCSNCKSKHIATFVSPIGMSSRVSLNTDLDTKEIKKFAMRNETSIQEILEIYKFLKNNTKIVL